MKTKIAHRKEPVSRIPVSSRESKYSMYRLVCTIGVLIIIGLLAMIGVQYAQYYRARSDLIAYQEKVDEQLIKQDAMEEEIERLKNLDYIEALARERLGLVKPDEVIFQFED